MEWRTRHVVFALVAALALAHFVVFLRPEGDLFLPGYKGAAFRGGFGSVFKSLACPTHPVDCLHARLGQRCVYSEVFETPVPSDSAVLRKYPYAPHPLVLKGCSSCSFVVTIFTREPVKSESQACAEARLAQGSLAAEDVVTSRRKATGTRCPEP